MHFAPINNMSLEDWQGNWPFDFSREYKNGTNRGDAAIKANQYWWHRQNTARRQDCTRGQRAGCRADIVGILS
jgi:hypothetical protein